MLTLMMLLVDTPPASDTRHADDAIADDVAERRCDTCRHARYDTPLPMMMMPP